MAPRLVTSFFVHELMRDDNFFLKNVHQQLQIGLAHRYTEAKIRAKMPVTKYRRAIVVATETTASKNLSDLRSF